METIWTKSKWNKDDLDNKTVEFRIPTQRGIEHGIGAFWVRQNPAGLLAIEVVTDVQGKDWLERIQTRFYLPQIGVDRIKRHPVQKVADFRLM
jgi:hypothetical protein